MDLADRLADLWYQDRERLGLATDAYQALRHGLGEFLPPEAIAGIAYDGEEAVVIALAKEVLLRFRAPEADRRLDANSLAVGAIERIAVTSELTGTAEANYRVCRWRIAARGGEWGALETRKPIGAGFGTENGGEAVMVALTERIGWSLPLAGEVAGR